MRHCPFVLAVLLLLVSTAPSQLLWRRLSPSSSPSARAGASLGYDGQSLILFGGKDAGGSYFSDTWRWDGSTWTRLSPSDAPPGRWDAAVAFDESRGKLILFGGANDRTVFRDTWEWDGTTWIPRFPASSPGRMLFSRIASDPGNARLVLFGQDDVRRNFETWVWDGSNWLERTQPMGPVPGYAYALALATDPVHLRPLLMMTARVQSTITPQTWQWNSPLWVDTATQPQPPQRYGHAMAGFTGARRVVLFGGRRLDTNVYNAETWSWDGNGWSLLQPPASPSARETGAFAYDPASASLILFGGYRSDGGGTVYFGDTWELYDPLAGAFSVFGSGCVGSGGTPELSASAPGTWPVVGRPFGVRLDMLAPQAPAFLHLGLSNSSWRLVPLPLPLDFLGAPGCALLVSPDLYLPVLNVGGTAPVSLPIPDESGLVGATFYLQGGAVDRPANALGLVLSNGGEARIGPR